MQRRTFLATLAAACTPRLTWADVGNPAFLAAGKRGEGFFLHALTATGESLFHLALPVVATPPPPTPSGPRLSPSPAAPALSP